MKIQDWAERLTLSKPLATLYLNSYSVFCYYKKELILGTLLKKGVGLFRSEFWRLQVQDWPVPSVQLWSGPPGSDITKAGVYMEEIMWQNKKPQRFVDEDQSFNNNLSQRN